MSSYDRVVTRYNNGITEVVDYENVIELGYTREKKIKHTISQISNVSFGRKKGKFSDFDDKNVQKNVFRATKKVRSLCNHYGHLLTKFYTLTYAFNISENDFSESNNLFKKFIMRVKHKYGSFEYLCVPELQKNGNIHYHMICSLPYIPVNEIQTIWSHGLVYITRIDSINNLGAYLSSYIEKDFGKSFPGKKHFFKSKGLVYPEPQKVFKGISEEYDKKNLVYSSTNFNVYCGRVETKIYNKNVEWT